MKINWSFLGGWGAKQKPSVGGVWIFSGTAQCRENVLGDLQQRELMVSFFSSKNLNHLESAVV